MAIKQQPFPKKKAIIGLQNHKIECIIGCEHSERVHPRPIFVDLKVQVDVSQCIKTDNIHDAVSYVFLADICTSIAKEGKFHLLETFASTVLKKLFEQLSITWGWIRVMKPNAVPTADFAVVELETGHLN